MSTNGRKAGKVCGIDAVILIANDFEGQCRFYADVLGLEMTARYSDAAFFKAGTQTLGIFARSHHPEGTKRLGGATHGLSHLEFRIDEGFQQEFVDRLTEAGAHSYKDNFADADNNLFHFTFSRDEDR
ncbi:MAG TPA: VOC family protein [Pyrinomonadaceae bacterium]|nr:VOC family protein [Pyrinomonadaceae bacterium]